MVGAELRLDAVFGRGVVLKCHDYVRMSKGWIIRRSISERLNGSRRTTSVVDQYIKLLNLVRD